MHLYTIRLFRLIGFVLCSAGPLHASDSVPLDAIEVHAFSDTSLHKPGYHYISRKELEGRFINLSDFLAQINGLQIQQLSGLGNPALVSIRGASAQQTKVLINGIDASDAQYGGYNLNELPINQIESIEIIQDGSDGVDRAIGGTILITTRQETMSQLSVQAGSYGTFTTSFSQPMGSDWQLQIDHQQSQNNYRYPVPSPAFDSQNRYKEESLNNAEFDRQSLQISGGGDSLSARLRLARQQKNTEDFSRNHPQNAAYLADQTAALEFSGTQQWLSMQQRWKIGHNHRNQSFVDRQGYIGLGKDDNEYRYNKTYFSLDNQKYWQQWRHSSDIQFSEETYNSHDFIDKDSKACLTPQGSCDTFSYQHAGAVGTALHWENPRYTQSFHASIYHQRLQGLSRPRYAMRVITNTNREHFTGASIGYQWELAHSEWGLNWKRAARIPTLYERYGNHGLFLSNTDLKTEISQTLSIDVFWPLTNRWQISLALFQRELENAIVPVYDSRGIGRYENTSNAQLTGLEWNIYYSHAAWFSRLSGSHYDSTTQSTVKSFQNKQLAGTYHDNLQWQAGWQNKTHAFDTSIELSDNLYLDRSNLIAGEQRWLWNASYRHLLPTTELGVRLRNLTNHRFLDYTNRPTIGREWLVFLNLNF